jgi:aspartyl-tRNA(Asn)/glutamyl-tRNA(Gln) amidotransferase subunit A
MPWTITEAVEALRSRALSSEELVEAAFAQADRFDDRLRVYIKRFDDTALDAARAADRDFAAGVDRGPLQGIPIGVKDVIFTEEAATTGGSEVRNPAWEQRRDATAVAKLRAAGAVITGKLTTVEFAIGVADPAKPLTQVRNPWDEERWAGASSSGSGAGVGAHMMLGALGTDTAGSVRLPASYCGVTGLKPTFGRVSKTGVIPLGASLDCIGPLVHSAADAALVLQAMAGPDAADTSAVNAPCPDFSQGIGRSLTGLRIGVERKNHLYGPLVDPQLPACFEEAVKALEDAGAVVREIEIPHYQQICDAIMITIYCESLAYHQRHLREQWSRYAQPTRMGIVSGALFSGADYVAAQKVRRAARRAVDRLFDDVDLICSPSTTSVAPRFEGLDLVKLVDTLRTPIWSGLGNPAISVPMGFDAAGLPFGLQLAGRPFDEAGVLHAADGFQALTDWHRRVPHMLSDGRREEAPSV